MTKYMEITMKRYAVIIAALVMRHCALATDDVNAMKELKASSIS
jgi:hypothetical protein